jgi:predicted aldo/keto reductase-like oxidoreductase
METVRLGRTNLTVKKLGWGSIPIQRVNEAQAVAVVQEAINLGVDLIDTARGYTTSEHRIGMAIKNAGNRSSFLRNPRSGRKRSMMMFRRAFACSRWGKFTFTTCTTFPSRKITRR